MAGIGKFLKPDTTSALDSIMKRDTRVKAANSRSVENREELQSSGQGSSANEASSALIFKIPISKRPSPFDPQRERVKGLLNECYGHQFEEIYAYRVNGALCFAESLEGIAERFGIPQEILALLKDVGGEYAGQDLTVKRLGLDEIEQVLEEGLTRQKQLIRDMVRDIDGTELKEVYTYKINGRLCLEEDPEAMAKKFGIPEQMLAGLKDVGYLYQGTTPTDEEITVKRIGLEEAIEELAGEILPYVWEMIKTLVSELFGTQIQSEAVHAYRVNNELRIVESPEAMARDLGLPETGLAILKDMDEGYRGRNIQGQIITIKRVTLGDALMQLGEQFLSQNESSKTGPRV